MQPAIASRQNQRVRTLRAALAGRHTDDAVAIESPHMVREALDAPGVQVLAVYAREDRADVLRGLPAGVEAVLLTADVFASVAATQQSQGVAALLRRPALPFHAAPGQLLLLLDGVQDPGNVGTLVRSAEAFGAAAVLVTEGTADAWNGKALRAAAGATFRLPVVAFTPSLQEELRQHGAVPAEELNLQQGCVLVVGNEGNGIGRALLDTADARVTLRMPGGTESLNAAVAGSVLLYEAARQRAAAARPNTRNGGQ